MAGPSQSCFGCSWLIWFLFKASRDLFCRVSKEKKGGVGGSHRDPDLGDVSSFPTSNRSFFILNFCLTLAWVQAAFVSLGRVNYKPAKKTQNKPQILTFKEFSCPPHNLPSFLAALFNRSFQEHGSLIFEIGRWDSLWLRHRSEESVSGQAELNRVGTVGWRTQRRRCLGVGNALGAWQCLAVPPWRFVAQAIERVFFSRGWS